MFGGFVWWRWRGLDDFGRGAVVRGQAGVGECSIPNGATTRRGIGRIGTAVVRGMPRMLAATAEVLALVGFAGDTGLHHQLQRPLLNPRYTPVAESSDTTPPDRHFPKSRMEPELLMVDADHDLATGGHDRAGSRRTNVLHKSPVSTRVQDIGRDPWAHQSTTARCPSQECRLQ